MVLPGIKRYPGVIRNVRAIAWISEILAKATCRSLPARPPCARLRRRVCAPVLQHACEARTHRKLRPRDHSARCRRAALLRWHHPPTRAPPATSQPSVRDGGRTLITSGRVAELSTVDPEVRGPVRVRSCARDLRSVARVQPHRLRACAAAQVLAQLLSSALYYMAEETELTHVVRLRPNESIGPCLLPECNALLVSRLNPKP